MVFKPLVTEITHYILFVLILEYHISIYVLFVVAAITREAIYLRKIYFSAFKNELN